MSKVTQDGLKAMGFHVYVEHFRYAPHPYDAIACTERKIREAFKDLSTVSPKGGRTIVVITSSGGDSYTGTADCSVLDNFNRKIGFQIAAGRALKAFRELTR